MTCCICNTTEALWQLTTYSSTGCTLLEVACRVHIADVAETQLDPSTFWVIVPIMSTT